jgi:CDGSH-type Zn-finger protein
MGITMKVKTAKNAPYPIEVIKGQTYYWCSCGLSENQPFCDGSHQRTDLLPVEYIAAESKTVYFCGCKQSATGSLCDGTHNTL